MKIENRAEWLTIAETAGQSSAAEALARPQAANGNFGDELQKAVSALDSSQNAADAEVRTVAMGGGNLHEMAIALEKADISMRLATKVRNKVIDAYHDIVKMSV